MFCKGGFGIICLDLLVINKIDLVLFVGADFDVMWRDAARVWGEWLMVFMLLVDDSLVVSVVAFVELFF